VNVNKQLLAELEKIENDSGAKSKTMGDVFTSMVASLFFKKTKKQTRTLLSFGFA